MDMAFGMQFSSVVVALIFTSITLNGSIVSDNDLLYPVEAFLLSAIKASGGRFPETCCLTVKAGKVRTFLPKYRLYLTFFSKCVKLCLALMQLGAVS